MRRLALTHLPSQGVSRPSWLGRRNCERFARCQRPSSVAKQAQSGAEQKFLRVRATFQLIPYQLVGIFKITDWETLKINSPDQVKTPEDMMRKADTKQDAKAKILEAALSVIRTKGYSATTVDELCAAAGVTKGAFFHHFKSKEELGIAAADYWTEKTGALFAEAAYHAPADPLARVLGYIDLRAALLEGEVPDFTCLVGTMVQEMYETAPAIREACARSISSHAQTLESDIQAAIDARGLTPEWSAQSLALHTQAVLQGAFILAKATGGAAIAADSIAHLKRYVSTLFNKGETP